VGVGPKNRADLQASAEYGGARQGVSLGTQLPVEAAGEDGFVVRAGQHQQGGVLQRGYGALQGLLAGAYA
jgi:hypothetical protein